MDEKVQRLLNVLKTLTEAQKKEFLDQAKGHKDTGALDESLRKRKEEGVVMGPLSGRCPYCGK